VANTLIFSILLQLCLPCISLFAKESTPEKEVVREYKYFSQIRDRLFRNIKPKTGENLTPDQIQRIIDTSTTETFVGNPTLRVENSSILRPIKQIGLRVLDGEIGIVQTFLSYEAVKFLKESLTGKRVNVALGTARKIVRSMTPNELKGVNGSLNKMTIGSQISKALKTAPMGVQKFMKSEVNFALMAVVGALINMGIYDGLDVNTMKDKILALDPLKYNTTASHGVLPNFLGGVASRQFFTLFNNKFDVIYDRILNSRSFGGYFLKRMDTSADVIGRKIFKATRLGIETESGESLAKRLGLVGVGEGTQFTLKGFLRSMSTGLAFGLGAKLAVDSIVVGARGYVDTAVVGGNRNKKTLRPEYNSFAYQRSQSEIKNWLSERKFALLDLFDGYRKTPLTNVVSAASGMIGGYFGSVIAGAVLVGGGLPAIVGGVMIASLFAGIGSFLGQWSTLKFERGKFMKGVRRQLIERRLYKAILKMNVFTKAKITKDKARDLAKARSEDMYKRESFGQVYSRLFLVESFDKIELMRSGDVFTLKVAEEHGEPLDVEAHIRYDFINLEGDQGVWDIVTSKVYNVGNVQQNSGFSVIFITDNENIILGDGTLDSVKGSEFRVLSNGLIMTLSDFDRERWVIRGQNVNTDVFLRNRAERYTWDYDREVYILVNPLRIMSSHPLNQFRKFFDDSVDQKNIIKALKTHIQLRYKETLAAGRSLLESVNADNELAFLHSLEKVGVDEAQTHKFAGMQRSQWKNLLLGRLQRSSSRQFQSVIDKLNSLDSQSLKQSFNLELKDESQNTIWDQVRPLMSAELLIASIAN
tara:strand:+ start:6375 stop:8819 length:2445 start_codon:yes stop_codon:yes gene_type:complete